MDFAGDDVGGGVGVGVRLHVDDQWQRQRASGNGFEQIVRLLHAVDVESEKW